MRDVGKSGDTFQGDTFVGGAHELSQTLESATRQDPARFALLIDEMDATDLPEYFEGILRGLTGSEKDSPRAGTLDQTTRVLRRIRELGVKVHGPDVARAIGALADEPITDDLVRWLCHIATDDPDPETDNWLGPDGPMAPINQAINTSRGAAAEALARLLFADRSRWDMLKDTVHRLAQDRVLAVRAAAAHCLLALLSTSQDEAIECFHRLTEGADSIISSHYVEHFINRATRRDYAAMRPTLNRLLKSEEPSAVRVAARWIVLSALSPENRDARQDEQHVLAMDENTRAGAADIYAAHVADREVGPQCAIRVGESFNDTSEHVRSAAVRCWYSLSPDQITEQGTLIRAFADSAAFEETRTSVLLHRLEEASLPLPVELCDIAERAIETYGERAASPQYSEAFSR